MAKRLNKKIAIIGSLVVAVMVVAAILFILNMSKDPQKFLDDARAEMANAEPDYKIAGKNYGKAFAYSKETPAKIDILFELSEMYIQADEWNKAAGCWKKVTTLDTSNAEAMLSLLDYTYEVAMAGNWTSWKDIETDSADLIEKQIDTSARMYRINGQATLEQVKRGQKTDKTAAIKQTIETLQKAREIEPNNVDVYQYLADAMITKGTIMAEKGVLGAAKNAKEQAEKILADGIENNPQSAKAYLNLYNVNLEASRSDTEIFDSLEKDLTALTEQFPQSPLAWSGLSMLYQSRPKYLDKALEAAEKAYSCESDNVNYALVIANLLYRKSQKTKSENDFSKAVDLANQALSYPDSIDKPGPRARISFLNRFSLHTFLANCYIERTSELSASDPDKAKWLEKGKGEVHEIIQLLGSAENPYAIMWAGRVALAEGDKQEGVKMLNAAYELLTASGEKKGDPQLGQLSYYLAEALKDTTEIGAALGFYNTAITNGIHYSKPEALLDYASTMGKVRAWQRVIEITDFFEENYYTNPEAKKLRISAYIGSNMLEKAAEEIAKLDSQDPNRAKYEIVLLERKTMNLVRENTGSGKEQAVKTAKQIDEHRQQQIQIMEKLLAEPSKQNEALLQDLCKRYIAGKNYDKASKFVSNYLAEFPDSPNILIFESVLAEPEPNNIPKDRLVEIALQAIKSTKDTVVRDLSLGQYYLSNGDTDKAILSYEDVLAAEPNNLTAISILFNIAQTQKDIDSMEKLAAVAKKYDVDNLKGEMFRTQLDIANEEYQKALERIENCIKERPIFSRGYLLRSQIHNRMQNLDDAIADAQKAYELNPTDGTISKNLAFLFYARDSKLGANVSISQAAQTKQAIESAMLSNPKDDDLKSFYAEYISDTSPEIAIAIGQQMQKATPTATNALRLGNLAIRIAANTDSIKKKKALYDIAEDAFENAYELEPENKVVLNTYSELLRFMGRPDEAQKLLAGNSDLLWMLHLRNGQIEEASAILDKLYQDNPKDANTVNGLLLIARSNRDNDGIIKYSNEFVELNDTTNSKLLRIESLLEAGLAQQAESRLDDLIKENPDEPRAMFFQSWLLAKQGKLKEALVSTNKTLEIDSKNARTWRLKGQINMGLGNFNDAIDDFRQSKLLQSDPATRVDLGKVYVKTGQYDEAVTELKIALEQEESHQTRSFIEQVYTLSQKTAKLERFYKDTLTKFPNAVYWYNQYASFKLKQEEYAQAFDIFEKAYQLSVSANAAAPDMRAFDGRLQSLLLEKKYDQLISLATKDVEGPYAAIAYARMANAKFQLGDESTSVQFFRRALEKAGADENFMIEILRQMNSILGKDQAIKWCNEKLQTDPDSIAVNLSMFNIYLIPGEYNKALKYIDRCIELTADNDQFNATYKMNKANALQMAYAKTSDNSYLDKAVNEYESLLQKQPMNLAVLNNLAYILAETKTNVDKALEYAKKAYEALPNNPNVLDTYGYVLLMNEKYEQADEILQMALQLFEQSSVTAPAEVYEHIGMAKEKLGQNADAVKAYQQAIEIQSTLSQQKKLELKNAIERLSAQ